MARILVLATITVLPTFALATDGVIDGTVDGTDSAIDMHDALRDIEGLDTSPVDVRVVRQ